MNRPPCMAITGASGLVGRHLCEYFTAQGWPVRGLVRDPRKQDASSGVDWFRCDLPDHIDPAGLEGADVLVHAAYTTRYQHLDHARRINEEGSRRLFDMARRSEVGSIMFLSSFSSRPNALSYYGRSKYAVEQLLDPHRDLAVRAGLVLAADGGLFCRIVDMLQRAKLVPLVAGRNIVQTLHIDDLCRACLQAIEKRLAGLLHVAEPTGQTFGDLLRLVLSHLRRRCFLLPVPCTPVLAGLRVAERLGAKLGVTSENLQGLRALRYVDVQDDLTRLGVMPRTAAESVAALARQLGSPRHPNGVMPC